MRFPQECRYDASHQDQYQPRREQKHAGGQAQCHDALLNQLAERPDHAHSVDRLDPRSLQLVVEIGIFIRRQIELRGVLHDLQAAVHHEAGGEYLVEVVDCAREHHRKPRHEKGGHHQQPKVLGKLLMPGDVGDHGVNDQPRRQQDAEGHKRYSQPKNQAQGDRRRRRVPEHAQHGRHVPQRGYAFLPTVAQDFREPHSCSQFVCETHLKLRLCLRTIGLGGGGLTLFPGPRSWQLPCAVALISGRRSGKGSPFT